jgi:small subunit ribosomal protein S20
MPHTKSAEKRLRQSEARRVRNKSHKSAMKTQIKKLFVAMKDEKADKSAALSATFKSIDQVAAKHIIHKNKANRIKSRLAKRMNQASQ